MERSGSTYRVDTPPFTDPKTRPGNYRRVNLKVFPYHIAYSIRGEEIILWAIAHSHKRPGYWAKRMR